MLKFYLAVSVCSLVVFADAALGVTIPTVLVGDAGNADDAEGYGGVAYEYRMSTYEVTNTQYVEFLNAKASTDLIGLWNSRMASSPYGGITRTGLVGAFTYATRSNMGDKPVVFVSRTDAMRFANWMHNGQGSAGMEDGAYTMVADRWAITRNAGAGWFLPSFDEWYKAACYQPASSGGDVDSYWLYATRSNDAPVGATAIPPVFQIANPGANVANYANSVGFMTPVGGAGDLSRSYYGTSDQAGNAWEIVEDIYFQGLFPTNKTMRTGGHFGSEVFQLANPSQYSIEEGFAAEGQTGFRLAAKATIPEPSTIALAAFGLIALAGVAVRRARSI